jgi:hypothetical protein
MGFVYTAHRGSDMAKGKIDEPVSIGIDIG